MSTRKILILQGGGALGAYECGVYQELAPGLDDLAVVAGTSIGAINASLIAKYYRQEDRGAATLERFWKDILANPSFPFCPIPGAFQPLHAVWTSVLFGNRHLFTPRLWNPLVPLSAQSFYSAQPMEQTVDHHFGGYGPGKAEPRLILTAVDIQAGTMRAFDSFQERITAQQVVACCSLPPAYPAKACEGKFYWDGGLWSNTPLPEVLNALQASQMSELSPLYRVYIVDVFPSQGEVPRNLLEVSPRMAEIIFADKTVYDKKAAEWVNRYISLLWALKSCKDELPSSLQERLTQEYNEVPALEKRVILDITYIKRSALPYEEISSGSDFSPERIGLLMAQGRTDAKQALETRAKEPVARLWSSRAEESLAQR